MEALQDVLSYREMADSNKKQELNKLPLINDNVKEMLSRDRLLDEYSSDILHEINSVFNNALKEDYSIELKKDELDDADDNLIIYVCLPEEKVSLDEMMNLWKRISVKSVDVVKEITKNSHEFKDMLERTNITLKRC
jgi:hypothetical protein